MSLTIGGFGWVAVLLIALWVFRARHPAPDPKELEVEWSDWDEDEEDEEEDEPEDYAQAMRERDAAFNIAARHLASLVRIALADDASADELRKMANDATDDFATEAQVGTYNKVRGIQ